MAATTIPLSRYSTPPATAGEDRQPPRARLGDHTSAGDTRRIAVRVLARGHEDLRRGMRLELRAGHGPRRVAQGHGVRGAVERVAARGAGDRLRVGHDNRVELRLLGVCLRAGLGVVDEQALAGAVGRILCIAVVGPDRPRQEVLVEQVNRRGVVVVGVVAAELTFERRHIV